MSRPSRATAVRSTTMSGPATALSPPPSSSLETQGMIEP